MVILICLFLLWTSVATGGGLPYFNDANSPALPDAVGFPRTVLTETKALVEPLARYRKYDVFSTQAGSINKAAQIQAGSSESRYLRHFSQRAYQGFNAPNPCLQGTNLPFGSTGPATQNCEVFAGHWLYASGTQLSSAISDADTILPVMDANKIKAGQYAVIYDANSASFANAEHVLVQAKNGNQLTVVRGYKSIKQPHAEGSVIAMHVLGRAGGESRNWSYNLSTASPRDAQNKTAGQATADWLAANVAEDAAGRVVNIRVDGILFDADPRFFDTPDADMNNDAVVDNGIISGKNVWGAGLDQFYGYVRQKLPNLILSGGTSHTRGLHINGTQMEGWPVSGDYYNPHPNYKTVDALLANYSYHVSKNENAMLTHNLTKTPSRIYPRGTAIGTNATFRFAFGLTLLDNGYYGQENSPQHPDPWYDEYAVDTLSGSATYGQAVASNPVDESAIIRHRHWLGRPITARYRLYEDAGYTQDKALLGGTFEQSLTGWQGRNVTLSQVSGLEGFALQSSNHVQYASSVNQASITSPRIALVKDQVYSLAFSARATTEREIAVGMGSQSQRFIIGPQWRRYVMTWKAPASGNFAVVFGVGREDTEVQIDSVFLFNGDVDLFRRDFEKGAVLVNATSSAQTVILNKPYQRIKGQQDPEVNDGERVTQITIPPNDAAILVNVPLD